MSPFLLVSLILILATAVTVIITGGIVLPLSAGAVVWMLCTAAGVCFQRLQFFGPIVNRLGKGAKGILLTFDDGPDPETTPEVLHWLERKKVKAVFFLVGQKALAHPDLVRDIISRGHSIGSHTDNHYWFTNFLTGRKLQKELESGIRHLESAGAGPVSLFRYPVGLSNPVIAHEVQKRGLAVMGWNRRCFDTQYGSPDRMIRRLKKARSGDIVLLHDSGRYTQAMLETLEKLSEEMDFRVDLKYIQK